MNGCHVFQFFWGMLTLVVWAIYLQTGYMQSLIVAALNAICLILISRNMLRESRD